jgi:ElaB/YqjD/DUF883 family membrane-anchored ribosome-binding protein
MSDELAGDLNVLHKDLDKLRRDVAGLAGRVEGDVAAALAAKLGAVQTELSAAAAKAEAVGRQQVGDAGRRIAEQPLLSVLVAFGAGALLSRLLSR